jgi:Phosphotransferase enzyme family
MAETPLGSGHTSSNLIVRVGDTVRRPRGDGSEVVEALLLHLEKAAWPFSPRLLGIDENNRQVLTYVVGEVHRQPPWQHDDDASAVQLGLVAGLLRSLHGAVATFAPPPGLSPLRPLPVTGSTWTHGDPGYSNLVYDDRAIVGLIDWEFAGPADPLCDVAALLAVSVRGPRPDADDQPRRIRAVQLAAEAIAENYGLDSDQISRLPDAVALVLEDTVRHWQTTEASPDEVERLRWRATWFREWPGP